MTSTSALKTGHHGMNKSKAYPVTLWHNMLSKRHFSGLGIILFVVCLGAEVYFEPGSCKTENLGFSTTSASVYRGSQYWKKGVTQSVTTILETPFCRFQVHQVQLGNGTLIKDWLWYDEGDNVNVLVQHGETGDFWILEQTKYAIEGSTYAVIGGLIEPDDDDGNPLHAAQRELQEELQMEATQWKKLGDFVAAANRGGGTTHVYWAQNAKPITSGVAHSTSSGGIAEGELERQDVVRLSQSELLEALLGGRFQEIKWTATVALALLQEKAVRA